MATLMYGSAPVSSGEFPAINPDRSIDIEHKHSRVCEFLETHRYDALLLQRPGNFAWFTSGTDCTRNGSPETTAALFITPDSRVIACSNADSAQLFDRELFGLGFQLKERPWFEPRHVLINDLCRGRTVASDTGVGRTDDVSSLLTGMRTPLTSIECERLREIGRIVAHAVEATARNLRQGQAEAEAAGELAHRMIKQQVIPERIQIWADGQGQRYRHWGYGNDRIERYCVLSAIGRGHGLCVGAARTVSFGKPPEAVRMAHGRASLMLATGIHFSQPDWEIFEIWNRVKRIYEKFDCPDEWQLADQSDVIGYEISEIPLVPKSEFQLTPGMPVFWHPSVGPILVGDTVLVGERGTERLTPTDNWPKLKIEVKGARIDCPAILQRDGAG